MFFNFYISLYTNNSVSFTCHYILYLTLSKVVEEEFIDDYERPVLEKYEKITPTPTEKKKKVHYHNSTSSVFNTK